MRDVEYEKRCEESDAIEKFAIENGLDGLESDDPKLLAAWEEHLAELADYYEGP